MKKHFNIRVSGIVQGVFFRATTKERAGTLNITGFVRNDPDGSVYAEAEGEEQDVQAFVQWCHHGPPRARVDTCEVRESHLKYFDKFIIER